MISPGRLLWAVMFCLVGSLPAAGQIALPDSRTVIAWGEAGISDDETSDRQQAVAQARRNALEQVVGAYVSTTTRTRNFQLVEDQIYTQSTGFINRTEILQEKRDQTHRIQIRASVGLVPVTERLRASGLLRQWRVGVFIAPSRRDYPLLLGYAPKPQIMEISRRIEATIGQRLAEAGFKLVDSRHLAEQRRQFDRDRTVDLDRGQKVDLLMTGSVSFALRSSGGRLQQSICQVHAQILRVDTGEIIYQGNIGNTFDGVTLMVEPAVAEKFADSHGNGQLADGTPDLRTFAQGPSAALDKAVNLTALMAGEVAVSQISRLPAAVSAHILLEIHGLDFAQVIDLEEHLVRLSGVAALNTAAFGRSQNTMEVEYDGDAMMLARSLSRFDAVKKLGLKVDSVTKGKIVLVTR